MAKSYANPEEKKLFFSNGFLKERKFLQDGKLEGEYTSYFNNGQIMAQLHFVRGKKNGAAATYYHNSQVRENVTFINDKMDGPLYFLLRKRPHQGRGKL